MKKTKVIIGLLIIVMVLLILMPSSKAALQSNGGTIAKYALKNWVTNIRKMESIGGTLGLTETINSDLTSNSGSNNLDIHMQKNTEYGAIAILSASSYGNPNKIESGETTTGNETGIVININGEWVAVGLEDNISGIINGLKGVSKKYIDVYKNDRSGAMHVGDAMSEMARWHGGKAHWNGSGYSYSIMRSFEGSLFSYICGGLNGFWSSFEYEYPSRAIMICGEGI